MRQRLKVKSSENHRQQRHHANMRILEYVAKYATKDAADEAGDDSESEDEMSSVGEYESDDEEPAGPMEV